MDKLIAEIAKYVHETPKFSKEAFEMAKLSLMDAMGCAIHSLSYPACTKLLGPLVKGTIVPGGCRVPGVEAPLDPISAAFQIGLIIRWLDYNDTWLSLEWAHPSDNLGAILAIASFEKLSMRQVLEAMIMAYEIQGVLCLSFSCNLVGLDHVYFVKIASSAVSAKLMGASLKEIEYALSQAFIDLGPLRTYRHAPNTGSRKSWAAGDATSRGAFLAYLTMRGEAGYKTAITASKWGLEETIFKKELKLARPLGEYVINKILYKVHYPAEFHAQTAVEAACSLSLDAKEHLDEIVRIEIKTHAAALKIIDKKGPLKNPADRDHCMQYMVAAALLFGTLKAEHYEEDFAKNPQIDLLRDKMVLSEELQFTKDYQTQDKRSIASSLQIFYKDGTSSSKVTIEYPLGHERRRAESLPHLKNKLRSNLQTRYREEKVEEYLSMPLEEMSASQFMELWT